MQERTATKIAYMRENLHEISSSPPKSTVSVTGRDIRPGEVIYLLTLLLFATFGKTYFCRFEEVLGLKPARRAVFSSVFLANPLRRQKIIRVANK